MNEEIDLCYAAIQFVFGYVYLVLIYSLHPALSLSREALETKRASLGLNFLLNTPQHI
jgi:hypothetical protein